MSGNSTPNRYEDYEDLDRDLDEETTPSYGRMTLQEHTTPEYDYQLAENRRCALREAVESLPEGTKTDYILNRADEYLHWLQTGKRKLRG